MRVRHKLGFTMIELIIAIVLLGITMIPLGLMSIEFVKAIPYSRDLGIAQELAKTEMAKINNLSYSDSTLDDGYDNTASNYEGYLYDLRRTVNYVSGWNNNLKEVQVRVYPSGVTVNPLTNLLAYVADVSFGAGSSGGAVAGEEADSLVVSGGSISGSDLQNITLENTSSDPITITGVRISFSGGGGIKLNTITIDSVQRWSGTASSGATITLATSFALSGSTTYSNTGFFSFSKSLSSVSSLVFIMGDASETESYPW